MRKHLLLTVFACLVIGVVSLAGSALAETYRWRLATIVPQTSFHGEGLSKFAEKVDQKTNGEMKIQIGFNSAYGGWADAMKSVSMGTLEMMTEDISRWETVNKDFKILSFPYVFAGWDHYLKYMNSTLFEEQTKSLSGSNYHALIPSKRTVWKRGPYRVICSKRPIFTAADLKDLKLRIPEVQTSTRIYGYMGCKVTVIPWGEAYLALKQGMVEGITSPMDFVYDMKFHEVAPYITNTNEFLQNNMITVNKPKWDKLPSEIKKAMEDAIAEVVESSNDQLESRTEKDIQKILDEKGFFIRTGLSTFKEKIGPLAKEFESEGVWKQGLFEEIQKLK